MPSYDIAIAALAIDAPVKWTDNALSQHHFPGVSAARRGLARRIPYAALLHLALTRDLHVSLGMSVHGALGLARALLASPEQGGVKRASVRVMLDRAALERTLELRVRDALESAPTPRRGRPRRSRPE
jgi:hypothetical protein